MDISVGITPAVPLAPWPKSAIPHNKKNKPQLLGQGRAQLVNCASLAEAFSSKIDSPKS